MQRTGLMAPPDLYAEPARPGLMSPASAPADSVDARVCLWAVAAVLAAVELSVELALP